MLGNQLTESLAELRAQIDAVDDALLQLFAQRMELVKGVAEFKRENSVQVLDATREQQILEKVSRAVPPDMAEAAQQLFTTLMALSREYQRRTLSK